MCVCACLVRRQHPALPGTHSPTALNASRCLGGTDIVCRGFRPWCCDTGSSSHFTKLVMSSDPHSPLVTDLCLTRCDRPVPHSLVTDPCLTHYPHCSHPHAHHTLACSSTGKDKLTDKLSRCWCWSDTHRLTHSLARSPPNGPPPLFIYPARLGGHRVPPPTLAPPHLRTITMTTCALCLLFLVVSNADRKRAGLGVHQRNVKTLLEKGRPQRS